MKNTTMTEKLSYTLADLARLIVEKLADKPDDYATSIGEWKPDNVLGDPLKQFEALLRVDVGDWKKLLAEHEQRIAELEKDALQKAQRDAQLYGTGAYRLFPDGTAQHIPSQELRLVLGKDAAPTDGA